MDFGLLLAFRNPDRWRQPIDQLYADYIDQAVYAEELGYASIWTTEHPFAEDSWSPAILPILAAIAARTCSGCTTPPPSSRGRWWRTTTSSPTATAEPHAKEL